MGRKKKQGERTDLEQFVGGIRGGTIDLDTITVDHPNIYHQYGRTLSRVEDLTMRRKFRTEMTQCIHYIGEPGAGKSHKAFEAFNPDTHYVWPNDGRWWDGYAQQEVVIMNDYRGELPLNLLCQLIDKWPVSVPRRAREPMPFTSKTIIITSVDSLEDMYGVSADASENMNQLRRRVTTVRVLKNGPEVVRGNTSPDHKPPIDDLMDVLTFE